MPRHVSLPCPWELLSIAATSPCRPLPKSQYTPEPEAHAAEVEAVAPLTIRLARRRNHVVRVSLGEQSRLAVAVAGELGDTRSHRLVLIPATVPADDGIVLDVPAAVDALSLWHGSGTPHVLLVA
jgi:hypothetical protein